MASETPETDSFLMRIGNTVALLQALAESYQALADNYRAARDGGALGQPPGAGEGMLPAASATTVPRMPNTVPVELPTNAFRGKGFRYAIKMYLGAAKRKQPFKELAAALKAGGLESTSSDFERTLNATLHQLKKSGTVIQFPEGWDLADAYPESFKQRLATKESKPRKTTRRSRKKNDVSAKNERPGMVSFRVPRSAPTSEEKAG